MAEATAAASAGPGLRGREAIPRGSRTASSGTRRLCQSRSSWAAPSGHGARPAGWGAPDSRSAWRTARASCASGRLWCRPGRRESTARPSSSPSRKKCSVGPPACSLPPPKQPQTPTPPARARGPPGPTPAPEDTGTNGLALWEPRGRAAEPAAFPLPPGGPSSSSLRKEEPPSRRDVREGPGRGAVESAAVGGPHEGARALESPRAPPSRSGQALPEAPHEGLQDVLQQGVQGVHTHRAPPRGHAEHGRARVPGERGPEPAALPAPQRAALPRPGPRGAGGARPRLPGLQV